MTTSHDIGYTINFISNSVSQIDLTAGNILQTVNVGLSPKGIILIPRQAASVRLPMCRIPVQRPFQE